MCHKQTPQRLIGSGRLSPGEAESSYHHSPSLIVLLSGSRRRFCEASADDLELVGATGGQEWRVKMSRCAGHSGRSSRLIQKLESDRSFRILISKRFELRWLRTLQFFRRERFFEFRFSTNFVAKTIEKIQRTPIKARLRKAIGTIPIIVVVRRGTKRMSRYRDVAHSHCKRSFSKQHREER